MAADFTNSPSAGNTYTLGGKLFTYDGTAWQMSGGGGYKINKQIFTSSGTYTPTAGMQYCIIECVGSGGGGGGASGSAGFILFGAGGGGGSYARKYATAADIGASQTVTVGNAGTGGSGANSGTAGSDVSVGSLCIGKGGSGGGFASSAVSPPHVSGGVAGTGDITTPGGEGMGAYYSFGSTAAEPRQHSVGGSSCFGNAVYTSMSSGTLQTGTAGSNYGGGGSGGATYGTTGGSSATGGAGAKGIVIITEFCSMPVNAPYIPAGMLWGLTLSNNGSDATNDIDIAAGRATDSTNTDVMVLASSITKQLDASWAVGTNAGGLDTGSIANTTYHVFLIKRPDTGVVDVLYSTSATSPTMPANYTLKRRIGSIVRTGAAIKAFVQNGDDFSWLTPVKDVNATNPGTSAVTRTLTLPTGVKVLARYSVTSNASTTTDCPNGIYTSDLAVTDVVASGAGAVTTDHYISLAAMSEIGSTLETYTNTSAQIRSRIQTSGTNTLFIIFTLGWRDTRGRLA